ncbi:MAG: CarD family transcriptional regulator [Candidatus Aminicenantaceae bacterium]
MEPFKIGDKVIYPNQGLGVIEDIKEGDYQGEKFKIYHLRIPSPNTLILIPFSKAEEIGIRKPISLDSIEDIFEFMKNGTVDITMNWKGRYKEHVELMKTGAMDDMAFVLKGLFYLSLIKPLSFREKRMMEKVKELIITEISEVSALPSSVIEQKVMENLSYCYKDVTPGIDS